MPAIWQREGRDGGHHFAIDGQWLATGRKHIQARAASQQGGDECRACGDNVLTVVEDQQRLPGLQERAKGIHKVAPWLNGVAKNLCNHPSHGIRVCAYERREIDKPEPSGKTRDLVCRRMQRQPGFATAAHASECHKAIFLQ
jgi:hypothetical protein